MGSARDSARPLAKEKTYSTTGFKRFLNAHKLRPDYLHQPRPPRDERPTIVSENEVMAGPDHTKPPNLARGIPPIRMHRFVGTALGAGMWFFLMYRAKKDGPVLLGWKHPWDH